MVILLCNLIDPTQPSHTYNTRQNETVTAGDTTISPHTPDPCTVLREKFQFLGEGIHGKLSTKFPKSSMQSSISWRGAILGKLRTKVPQSSIRNSNFVGKAVVLVRFYPKSNYENFHFLGVGEGILCQE